MADETRGKSEGSPEAVALKLAMQIQMIEKPSVKPDDARAYWIKLYTLCLRATKGQEPVV